MCDVCRLPVLRGQCRSTRSALWLAFDAARAVASSRLPIADEPVDGSVHHRLARITAEPRRVLRLSVPSRSASLPELSRRHACRLLTNQLTAPYTIDSPASLPGPDGYCASVFHRDLPRSGSTPLVGSITTGSIAHDRRVSGATLASAFARNANTDGDRARSLR